MEVHNDNEPFNAIDFIKALMFSDAEAYVRELSRKFEDIANTHGVEIKDYSRIKFNSEI